MYELKVKNDVGEVLNLSSSKDYTLYQIEGLAPPKVNISSSGNATSDGITINRLSVESRNIVLYLTVNGDIETNRIKLYKYFPLKKTIAIYYKNETRDVYIEGTVEVIECDMFTNRQIAQVSIICPQPYFKSVKELVSTFSDVEPLFEFPFAIEKEGIEISAITPNIRKSIVNTGDIESGMIIKLYAIGEVVNPIIYDVFSRKFMAFNITLQPNDLLLVDTYMGEKSIKLIRHGETVNAIGYLRPDSTWLTLKAGDNVFTYEAEDGGTYLQITFTTSVLYGGV